MHVKVCVHLDIAYGSQLSPCLAPREEKELNTEGSELTESPGQSEEEGKCLLSIAGVNHTLSSLCDLSYR